MESETIAIGNDHAGYDLKVVLKKKLVDLGYKVRDFGSDSAESADYADFAHPLSEAVADAACDWGILICGSGNGVAMTANKHKGIRAALCWEPEIAGLARLHNNANVLCIPARYVSNEKAEAILHEFIRNAFEGGRHQRRIDKINC